MTDEHTQPESQDPFIDEVRSLRRAVSEEFGNDLHKLCEHLREIEAQHRDRVLKSRSRSKSTRTE